MKTNYLSNPGIPQKDIFPASEIMAYEDGILDKGERLLITEYSSLWLIQDQSRLYTLDHLASLIEGGHKKKSRGRLSKSYGNALVEDLRSQAKRLRALATTYELIATAISLASSEFESVVETDEIVKNAIHNPF